MKKVMYAVASCMMLIPATSALAEENEEKVTLEVGADMVSAYVWRGQDCGGFSIQPSATLTWNRPSISLGVWASAELFEGSQFANMNEFDIALSWSPCEAFSIGVTDYHFCDGNYWRDWNFSGNAVHNLELNASYDFGPLSVAWNTCLTGADYNNDGKRIYSTYVEVAAPFTIGGVECEGTVGVLPWTDSFTSGGENASFNVCNVAVKAQKEVKGIPFFGQIVLNPQTEGTYFVFGVSF